MSEFILCLLLFVDDTHLNYSPIS